MANKMLNLKRDFRFIIRDPMMMLLFAIPVIIPVVFKLLKTYGIPILNEYVMFSLLPYTGYVLSFSFVLVPTLLGAVTGFQMLDEKDGNIDELVSVTPLGRSGYMLSRVIFSFIVTFAYIVYSYLILNIYSLQILILLFVTLLTSLYALIIASLLYLLAEDKVKGLTYVKGLSFMIVFVFSNLIQNDFLSVIANVFPTYWLTEVITNPNIQNIAFSLIVHGLWVLLVTRKVLKGK